MKIIKNNANPLIFNKKSNKKYKIIPLKNSNLMLGVNRRFPPSVREWCNSIYTYNNNNMLNMSILDKNLNFLIKSYFNLHLNITNYKADNIPIRFRRLSLEKIFLGKIDLKHTNEKVNISLYVYNEEKRIINFKVNNILLNIFPKVPLYDKEKKQYKPLSLEYHINKFFNIKSYLTFSNYITNLYNNSIKRLDMQIDMLERPENLSTNEENIKQLKDITKFLSFFSSINTIEKYMEKKSFFEFIIFCTYQEKFLEEYSNNKLLLNINESKFEENYLSKLTFLIKKIYNKKIELNVINLKTLFLNSDMFTEAISLKLKNRGNNVWRVLKSSLHMLRLPYYYRTNRYYKKIIIRELLVNKANSLNKLLPGKSNDALISSILFNLLPFSSLKETDKPLIVNNKIIDGKSFVLNSLKYKFINGARLEAKGRLTKRFTASRSLFKLKWKGTLKDVDSSIRGLSSVVLRGNTKPNIEYSIINSKTRNGAFGLKGWTSGH